MDFEVGDEIVATGNNGRGLALPKGLRGIITDIQIHSMDPVCNRMEIAFDTSSPLRETVRQYCSPKEHWGQHYCDFATRFEILTPATDWSELMELE